MLLQLGLALLAAASAPDTARGAVRGVVYSETSGLPVALAVVELRAGPRVVQALADSAGGYAIRNVPVGRHRMRVRGLDFAPTELDVTVPPGRVVTLDVSLEPRPIAVSPVAATADLPLDPDERPRPAMAPGILELRALESGTGSMAAGTGLAGGRPAGGGQDPADPDDDVLYARGSAADLKLVLLDGAPVYAPFHMGGLLDTFEPGVLRQARLYLGGAPARYDGGLSYVMDLSTRPGAVRRHATAGAVDLVSARGVAEGPVAGGATYLVSGRTVYRGALDPTDRDRFPYEYSDGLLRLDLPLDSTGGLALTLFSNGEGVRMDADSLAARFARWGNVAGSFRYRGRLPGGRGGDVELTVAMSSFDVSLPWRGARALLLEGRTERARLALDAFSQRGASTLRWGGSFDRSLVMHEARARADAPDALVARRLVGHVAGAYVEGATPLGSRLLVRGGLRGDWFSHGRMVASPRLAVTWQAGDHAVLTVAGGRYHQFVRVHESTERAPSTLVDTLDFPTGLAVAAATHLSLALEQQLGERVRMGLEGFYKRFEGLPEGSEVGAYNSGMDVWVRGSNAGISGWMGYSLGWSWSYDGQGIGDRTRFEGRQVLSVGVAGQVQRLARVGMRVAYGSGLPFTALSSAAPVEGGSGSGNPNGPGGPTIGDRVDLGSDGPPLASPSPEPYLRVDAEISRTWSPRIGERRTELTPYFRVINALDRRDGLFYRYDGLPGERVPRAVASLPMLPVLGLAWRF